MCQTEITDFPKNEIAFLIHYQGKLMISTEQVHSRKNKVRKIREWAKLKKQWVM